MTDKTADLAGPGISTYEEVEKILPNDYEPLLTPMERMEALFDIKGYIEDNLCKELNLQTTWTETARAPRWSSRRGWGWSGRSRLRSSRPPPSGSGWR